MENKPVDFSFDKKDIRQEVDKLIEKKEKIVDTEIIERPVVDRIRIAHEIKKNPPEPGYMEVDVKPGIYSIDLNTDAHWWFNKSCTVFPTLLDQAIRTHVDIKDSFKVEKRHLDFEYWWLIFFLIMLPVALLLVNMVFKIF